MCVLFVLRLQLCGSIKPMIAFSHRIVVHFISTHSYFCITCALYLIYIKTISHYLWCMYVHTTNTVLSNIIPEAVCPHSSTALDVIAAIDGARDVAPFERKMQKVIVILAMSLH